MQDGERIHLLTQRYRRGIASEEEVRELLHLIRLVEHTKSFEAIIAEGLLDDIPQTLKTSPRMEKKMDDLFARIKRRKESNKPKIRKLYWRYAAAGILIALSIGIYGYLQNQKDKDRITAQVIDINPGGNKATLTLADGSTIALSDQQSGIIIGDEAIKYSDGSDLVIRERDSEGSLSLSQASTLSLSTPKGGQYQITLPDGTKVFVNSASTLRYPSRFEGNEREVEITGEAYFQVAHNKSKPFIVKSNKQEIRVLGTEFNVSNYEGEAIATTLLSGSVQLRFAEISTKPIILVPGQQAILKNNLPSIQQVNTEDYIAWTKGLFVFNDVPLKEIMNQLARWYDIEVTYPKNFREERFYAEIPRDRKLSEVLRYLEQSSNFKFTQKERRVIVEQ